MPSLYKLKVIAVGSSRSGKDFFFRNCAQISSSFSELSLLIIGVSMKIANYSNQNEDVLTMQLWDINASERFHFLYPSYFRGAAGCLLFFDVLDDNLYDNLRYWIGSVRANIEHIPILLVGFNSDFDDDFNYDEINAFAENNHLEGFYYIPPQIDFIINHLATTILENIGSEPSLVKIRNKLNSKEMKLYQNFLHSFLICPICKTRNHASYLNRFYFSKNPELKKLKENLLSLMKKSKSFDKIYLNEIRLDFGIPCCSCYNKFFSEQM